MRALLERDKEGVAFVGDPRTERTIDEMRKRFERQRAELGRMRIVKRQHGGEIERCRRAQHAIYGSEIWHLISPKAR